MATGWEALSNLADDVSEAVDTGWEALKGLGQSKPVKKAKAPSVTAKLPPARKASPETEQRVRNEQYWQEYFKKRGETISAPPPRSAGERFIDNMKLEASPGGSGVTGAIIRGISRAVLDEDQASRVTQTAQDMRDLAAMRDQEDPTWSEDRSFVENLLHGGASLGGAMAGDANLTYLIGSAAATPLKRILATGAIEGAIDTGLQSVENVEGLQKGWDPLRTVAATAGGAALQGAGEVVVKGAKYVQPVIGKITSGLGLRKAPKAGASTNHGGVDLAVGVGTPVVGPANGRVVATGRNDSKRGNWVEVEMEDGTTHRFLHLSGFNVKPGDSITKGKPFARSGASGNVTGPHLHWSVIGKDGKPVDPMKGGPVAPDGLPGNEAVRPMDPQEIARIMGDADAAGRIGEEPDVPDMEEPLQRSESVEVDDGKNFYDNSDLDNSLRQIEDPDEFLDAFTRAMDQNPRWAPSDELIKRLDPLDFDAVYEKARRGEALTPEEDTLLKATGYVAEDKDLSPIEKVVDELYNDVAEGAYLDEFDFNGPGDINRASHPGKEGKGGGVWNTIKDVFDDEGGALHLDGQGPGKKGKEPKQENNPYEGLSPEDKLAKTLKELKPARKEQTTLNSEMRKKQEALLRQMKESNAPMAVRAAALKGALPVAEWESIAKHFSDEDITALKKQIDASPALSGFDTFTAQRALEKILDPNGVRLPQPHEMKLLHDVFKSDVTRALSEKAHKLSIFDWAGEILGAPRAAISAGDVSAPFRQGLGLIGKKEFWDNYPDMHKMMLDEDFYNATMDEIKTRPNYGLMRDADLAVRDIDHFDISSREDAFLSSLPELGLRTIKDKTGLPVNYIGASNRAYSGFLRKLRADVFDNLIELGRKSGVNWEGNPAAVKALGRFINTATGRGELSLLGKSFESFAPFLSLGLFSPRLLKSRFDMLNPFYYYKLYRQSPFVAKEAMKSAKYILLFETMVLGLALAGGAEIETDPRSSDSFKIKIDDTRIDTGGGLQQLITLYSRVATGESKTLKGKTIDLDNPDYGGATRATVVGKFLRNKLAPIPGAIWSWLEGKDPVGREYTLERAATSLVLPMWLPDIIEIWKKDPIKGAALTIPAFAGISVSEFDDLEKEKKKKKKEKQKKKDSQTVKTDGWDAGWGSTPNPNKGWQ